MPIRPIPTDQIPNAIGNPAFTSKAQGVNSQAPKIPNPQAPIAPGGPRLQNPPQVKPPIPIRPQTGPPQTPQPQAPINSRRDMRTEVTEADKGPVKDLAAKGLAILHQEDITNKLSALIKKGEDPSVVAADILDDILFILDKQVVNGIPFAQLVLLAIILLSDINKIIASLSNKPLDKSHLKLALKSSVENVVGKETINKLNNPNIGG